MFERILRNIIQDGVDEASADDALLRRMLRSPGWLEGDDPDEEDEIQKLITGWTNGNITPKVVVNYPRASGTLPVFAVILANEATSQQFLADELGYYPDAEVMAEQAAIEKERGRPVDMLIQQFRLTYSIYVYSESPNTTLALYNFLRVLFLFKGRKLLEDCLDQPSFSGSDLMPEQGKEPSLVFTRVFTVNGFGHQLFFSDFELGPLGFGRGRTVTGLHVNSQIDTTGLLDDPGIDPYED